MPRQCRYVPCRPLATIAALASGTTVFAARSENTAAIPAGTAVGTTTTGHHITRLPKLAPSCDRKISPAVTAAPAAVRAERVRSKRPVRTSRRAVRSRRGSDMSVAVLAAGQVLLHLLLDALLDEAGGVLVTVQHGGRGCLHLLERRVRGGGGHVGVAADVEHGRPVGRQRGVPGRTDAVGGVDVDALQPQGAGEGGVVDVGEGLRLRELG